jgi:hypothetical protein
MKSVAEFLGNPAEFFKNEHNHKKIVLSVLIPVFLCTLILLVTIAARRGEDPEHIAEPRVTSVAITSTVTPTKWWIKMTSTLSPTPLLVTTTTTPLGSSADHCPANFSSTLRIGTYAYISLTPPLPNRLRSGAGLRHGYLGQVEPGGGLKVLDGPLCSDGYSWWLVESLYGGLRGWTIEGRNLEQWVVPCLKESTPCSQVVVSATSSLAPHTNTGINKNYCKSDKLSAGMLAQVGQESLLVVRLEPNAGEVLGRAGPKSIVKVLAGPVCAGGTLWWKLNVHDRDLVGWAAENDLDACQKDSECNLSSK